MNRCEACVHFRAVRRQSEALARDANATEKSALDALAKIREEEARIADQELKVKMEHMLRLQEAWPGPERPRMTDYCGLREREQVYLIRDLKNAGGRCRDFAAGQPPTRSCHTCVHRSEPFGQERDLRLTIGYMAVAGAANRNRILEKSSQDRVTNHLNACAQAVANQLTLAFGSDGHLPSRPEYLSVCKSRSTHGQTYAVCAILNPHGACDLWQPDARANTDRAPVLELTSAQLDWAESPPYAFHLDGATLRLRLPDPALGPDLQLSYAAEHATRDGACQLVTSDGTPLPLLVRFQHGVAYVRHGDIDAKAGYPLLRPTLTNPRRFRPCAHKYYQHPNPKLHFGVMASHDNLILTHGYGLKTTIDLKTLPRGRWVSPHDRGMTFPVRLRLGWLEGMIGAYVPEVEWLD
jgi:hypothetical protein